MSTDVNLPISDGRYRLVDVLGEGGMAVVYRAYDERLQVYRAVKVLSSVYGASSTLQERFLKEARTMARIQHPNIVAVHDMGSDGLRSFMVMEILEGGSLNDWLARHGPMPPRLALEALLPVLRALEAAHAAGVVHRDIKPQNILLTGRGLPKVTDFGIARVTDSDAPLTRTGSVMGTWGFMAPEQRMNAKQVDGRADLYAVGASLFTLLVNELPVDLFVNEIDGAVFDRVDPLVRPILRKATRYRPEDRYQSAAEMAEALDDVLRLLPALPEDTPPLAGPALSAPTPPPAAVPDSRETMVPDAAEPRPNATFIPEEPGEAAAASAPPDEAPAGLDFDGSEALADEPMPELRQRRGPVVAAGVALLLLLLLGVWAVKGAGGAGSAAANAPEEPTAAGPAVAEPAVAEPAVAEAPEPPPAEVLPVEAPEAPPEAAPGVRPAKARPTGAPREPDPPVLSPPVEPVAPAAVEPPAPAAARVSLRGDAASVSLQAADGGRFSAGEVPPGSYTIYATFEGGSAMPAGKVTLEPGERVTINCTANFAACKAER